MLGLIPLLILAAIGYSAMQKGKNPFTAILKAIIYPILAIGALLIVHFAYLSSRDASTTPSSSSSTTESDWRRRWDTPGLAVSGPISTPVPRMDPTIVKSVDHLGRVLYDAAVTDSSDVLIATIHRDRPVHIIEIGGGRTRIRLHDGQEGFVASDSVVDVGDWIGSLPERSGSP